MILICSKDKSLDCDGENCAGGCNGPVSDGYRLVTHYGQRFDRCPACWLADRQDLIQLFTDCLFLRNHGIMPFSGGLLDQNPVYMSATGVVDAALARVGELEKARDGTTTKPKSQANLSRR